MPKIKLLHGYMAKLLTNKKQFNPTPSSNTRLRRASNLTRQRRGSPKWAAIKQSSNGFSLIELLTVITIIGILAAVAMASFSQAQKRARDSKRKADLKAIQQVLEVYFQDYGNYPEDIANYAIVCNDDTGTPRMIENGDVFECTDTDVVPPVTHTYMNQIPTDPKNSTADNFYYYYDKVNEHKYTLTNRLENSNDPDLDSSSCTFNWGGTNYCVESPKWK